MFSAIKNKVKILLYVWQELHKCSVNYANESRKDNILNIKCNIGRPCSKWGLRGTVSGLAPPFYLLQITISWLEFHQSSFW